MARVGRPRKDITGMRFGRLTATRPLRSHNGDMVWEFVCDCGNVVQRMVNNVQRSNDQACPTCRAEATGDRCRTHGMSRTPLYIVWKNMVRRCTDSKSKDWHCYGGRGITVCDSWLSFESFYNDMSGTYAEGLELDRLDNNGSYCKENCKWVSHKENCRNQKRCYVVDSKLLERESGIQARTIRDRIKRGWPIDMLTIPARKNNKVLKLGGINKHKYKYEGEQ